jgi:hypothetical protein
MVEAAKSQGCLVVRNISGFGQYNLTDKSFSTADWQLNIITGTLNRTVILKELLIKKLPSRIKR